MTGFVEVSEMDATGKTVVELVKRVDTLERYITTLDGRLAETRSALSARIDNAVWQTDGDALSTLEPDSLDDLIARAQRRLSAAMRRSHALGWEPFGDHGAGFDANAFMLMAHKMGRAAREERER